MNKLRKLVLTVAALVALAVGGAAFAQAQNSGSSAPAQSKEAGTPGDPTDAPSAEDQAGEERTAGDPVDAPSAEDQHQSGDQQAGEAEDGGHDQPDGPGQEAGD